MKKKIGSGTYKKFFGMSGLKLFGVLGLGLVGASSFVLPPTLSRSC